MPQFAANLTTMYNEHSFLERFAAAAQDGFAAVEFLFPYNHAAADIRMRLDDAGLSLALFNAPPGDFAAGERGIAALPGREDEFRRSIHLALSYAVVLRAPRVHVMAGVIRDDVDRAAAREVFARNLARAAPLALSAGVTLVIEPINPRDMPGYFLTRQDDAHAICAEVRASNLKVQFDLYHAQIAEGDLAAKLRRYAGQVGHIQIAGVPDRHEPDFGEINYPYLFQLIDQLGYEGWIGCEYRPFAGTSAGLDWARPWLRPKHEARLTITEN